MYGCFRNLVCRLDTLHSKNIYLMSSVSSKNTLITGDVGGAGADPHTCKMGTFFLASLALRRPISNKMEVQKKLLNKKKMFDGFS